MRVAALVACAPLSFAGCTGPDLTRVEIGVDWMEWPAEVAPATSFSVRLVGHACPYAYDVATFVPLQRTDASAVTFEPYVLAEHAPCAVFLQGSSPVASAAYAAEWVFDTQVPVRDGLSGEAPRTYEVRGRAIVANPAWEPPVLGIRRFGEILVSPMATASRIEASGWARASLDASSCLRITYGPARSYVVDNPPDTARSWYAFVRGYLHSPAAPVCGETLVFHLLTRN